MTEPSPTEHVAPDEDQRFAGYAEEIRAIQRRRAAKHGAGRGLHRKAHAGVEATFTVRDDVPAALRVGPFVPGRAYRAYVRYSNGGSRHDSDQTPDIRGLGIKLLDVDGPKVLGSARTQDFLLIHRSVQPFRTPDEFVGFARVSAAGGQATLPIRLARAFGPVRAFQMIRGILAMVRPPIASVVTTTWYSATPVRFGATAARYALRPVDPPQPAQPVPQGEGFYAADLAARLRVGPVRYDFLVQTFVDEARTPIEDASVDWSEAVSPLVPLARLEIPRQDADDKRQRAISAYVETLSFDPWHAVEELRPLGAMMRARKHAYYASTQERGAAPEPDGTERFPE
jgi:hypothetical protein